MRVTNEWTNQPTNKQIRVVTTAILFMQEIADWGRNASYKVSLRIKIRTQVIRSDSVRMQQFPLGRETFNDVRQMARPDAVIAGIHSE